MKGKNLAMSCLFLFIVFILKSQLTLCLHLLQNSKIQNLIFTYKHEADIDSDEEFSDSESDDDEIEKELDLDDREQLIVELLKTREKEKIDPLSLIQLGRLTEGFSSDEIKTLVTRSLKLSKDKPISTSSLFFAFYLARPEVEIQPEFRKFVISQYFLEKLELKEEFPILEKLSLINKPLFNLSFIYYFLRRVQRQAMLENSKINETIINEILSAYFKYYDIKEKIDDPTTIPSVKNLENHKTKIPSNFIIYNLENRFQFSVTNQMAANGGGSLSCGYHSAKNGLCIAQALATANYSSLNILSSDEYIKTHFGDNEGQLRHIVINMRKANLLMKLYSDILISNFLMGNKKIVEQIEKPAGLENLIYKLNFGNRWVVFNSINEDTDAQRFRIRQFIPDVCDSIKNEIVKLLMNKSVNININRNAVIDIFLKQIGVKQKQEPENGIYVKLNKREVVTSFFQNLNDISFAIDNETIQTQNPKCQIPVDIFANEMGKNKELFGENLDGVEIKKLYDYFKPKEGIKVDGNEIAAFDIINISDDNGSNPFKEIDSKLLAEIQNARISKIIVFNVHLPNHWITCVLDKNKDQFRYYIADSNANYNQLNNSLILRLIYFLETGKDLQYGVVSVNKNLEHTSNLNQITVDKEYPSIKIIDKNKLNFDLDKDYRGTLHANINHAVNDLLGKNNKRLYSSLYLFGPTGLGKSSIAEGIAKKTNRLLIKCDAPQSTSKFQASGSECLTYLFQLAKKINDPVILLIEEVDIIAKDRKLSSNNEETGRSAMTLTVLLDEYKLDPNIFVILTTNKPEVVEEALDDRAEATIAS